MISTMITGHGALFENIVYREREREIYIYISIYIYIWVIPAIIRHLLFRVTKKGP